MLIWINGPFGGGKTQTAHELHRRLAGSVICDPEELGFGLHRMLPPSVRGDFQDLAAWRQGVFEGLDLALREQQGTVIVPMTLINERYFHEIIDRLRDSHDDIHHFALLSTRATVVNRLRERGFGQLLNAAPAGVLRRESFALAMLDRCLEQLEKNQFAEHIWTEDITVSQVADHIATATGRSLRPDTDSPLRGRIRRAWVGAQHIRLR